MTEEPKRERSFATRKELLYNGKKRAKLQTTKTKARTRRKKK